MNPLRNKLLLKWREPRLAWKYAKRHLSRSDWLRHYLSFVVKSVLAAILLFAAIRLIRGEVNSFYDLISIEAVLAGAGVGIVLCFLSWIVSLSPVEIQIREKNIVRVAADGNALIPYKEVQMCTVREVELEGRKFEILEIKYWDGNECTLELASPASGETVMELLRQRGLQVRRT